MRDLATSCTKILDISSKVRTHPGDGDAKWRMTADGRSLARRKAGTRKANARPIFGARLVSRVRREWDVHRLSQSLDAAPVKHDQHSCDRIGKRDNADDISDLQTPPCVTDTTSRALRKRFVEHFRATMPLLFDMPTDDMLPGHLAPGLLLNLDGERELVPMQFGLAKIGAEER